MSYFIPVPIEHPALLIVVAVLCSPVLLWLARWFFGDFETFLNEVGYRAQDDVWWKCIRFGLVPVIFQPKVIGFLGLYAILVGLVYHTLAGFL